MTQRTVNARQLEVLTWIGAGCPEGVMGDLTYKTTAIALKTRRLVTVTKKRGTWTAALTDAGQHFLDTGQYPDGHWAIAVRGATPGQLADKRRRTARQVVTGRRPVDQLIADLVEAGGELVRPRLESNYWGNLAASAKRYGKIPPGKVLNIERGDSWDEQIITLADAPEWMRVNLAPIPVGDQLRKPHPIVAALKDAPDHLSVSRAARGRALRILDAFAKDAETRGYQVRAPRRESQYASTKGILEITIQGSAWVVDLDELQDKIPHIATATEIRDHERYSWRKIPTHDHVPSGRLRMRILTGCPVSLEKVNDAKTIDLVDRLPQLMQELELRAAASHERHLHQLRDEEHRRERWERAMAEATIAAVEHHRVQVLLDEVDRWLQCQQIDQYLQAAERSLPEAGAEREAALEWLVWARGYRASRDPIAIGLRMPETPRLTSDDLRPFLAGLSPYGP